jgi:hypothetical protein
LALAIGCIIIFALVSLVGRATRTGAEQRAVWQAAILGLAALFFAELTGFAGVVADWARERVMPPVLVVQPPETTPASPSQPWEEQLGSNGRQAVTARPFPPVKSQNGDLSSEEQPDASITDEAHSAWWPAALWLIGAVVVAGRACLARLLLAVFRWRRARLQDSSLDALIRSVADRLNYHRSVAMVESDRLMTPAAFGILRPTLALPTGFRAEFTPAQQEAMLAHELAHLAANDPAWHLLADIVTAALWWHPLAWWAKRQLRAASETAADEASLVVADGPGVLATCLVRLGTRLIEGRSAAWLSVAGNGFRSGLGRRVERLLRLDGAIRRPLGRMRFAMILTLGPALLLAASALSTAWARSPATTKGDVPMMRAWKRSLSAVVLITAFGIGSDAATGDDPTQEGTPKPGIPRSADRQDRKGQPAATLESDQKLADKIQSLVIQREALDAELKQITAQLGRLSVLKDDEPKSTKFVDERDELQAKIQALEEQRAALEVKLKELETRKVAATAVRIKVFRLKHRDPNEISAVLSELLPQPGAATGMMSSVMGGMTPGGMMGGGPGAGGVRGAGGPIGGGGMRGGPGGMPGMSPGGMKGGSASMGPPGMMPGSGMGGFGRAATGWRLAVDTRTNSLIVRGSAEDLRNIGELIAALDQADDKSAPKLKNFRTFRLKDAQANEVAGIVQALELKVTISVLQKGNMVAVTGDEAALKEVGELIEALDVEGKPAKGQPRQ